MRYRIKRGKHSFFKLPGFYLGKPNALEGTFKYERNCWYARPDDHVDWLDINKLTGISLGLHKNNSLRIGWRPLYDQKEQIELFAYFYNHGNRFFQSVAQVQTDKVYQFQLRMRRSESKAVLEIDGIGETGLDFEFPSTWWGYYLYPYFGGNKTAPQDMTIHVSTRLSR